MRWIYTIVYLFCLPWLNLYIRWRYREVPGFQRRFKEYYAKNNLPSISNPGSIWLHMASVGEIHACGALIHKLLQHYPEKKLLLTCNTATGSQRIKQLFSDQVIHCFAPFDCPWIIKRFIQQFTPLILINAETEIWPNRFYICKQAGIPIIQINARLSQKSFRFPRLVKQALSCVDHILAAGADDYKAYGQLADIAKIQLAGNLKFNSYVPDDFAPRQALFQQRFSYPFTWIAASIHPSEIDIILRAHKILLAQVPHAKCLIAPRHLKNVNPFLALGTKMGFKMTRKSAFKEDFDIMIIDSIGELVYIYPSMHAALVGGSLAPIGGHNVLEPMHFSTPTLSGPYYYHCRDVHEHMKEYIYYVDNEQAIAKKLIDLFDHPEKSDKHAQSAQARLKDSQKSLKKTLSVIERTMHKKIT